MPVSSFRWTRGPPARRAAAAAARATDSGVQATTSAPRGRGLAQSSPASGPITSRGASMPAARSSRASAAAATASALAPPSSAARATGAAPWP